MLRPRTTVYEIRIFFHTRSDGVQRQVNEWLRNCLHVGIVHAVTLSHDGAFHYATVLYSEADGEEG